MLNGILPISAGFGPSRSLLEHTDDHRPESIDFGGRAFMAIARSPEGARRIGYARVSTSDQRLESQLVCLKAAQCDAIHTDHGISGGTHQRRGLDCAMADLRKGDTLVVYKLDRLGRSVAHLAELLKEFEARGVNFLSLTEGIDTSTSGGRLVFHIFSAVAEFSRDIIRENTLVGLQAARQRGSRLGRRPRLSSAAIDEAVAHMSETGRSVSATAAFLGVPRTTLARALARRSAQ